MPRDSDRSQSAKSNRTQGPCSSLKNLMTATYMVQKYGSWAGAVDPGPELVILSKCLGQGKFNETVHMI